MIIPFSEAQQIYKDVTRDDLDGIEIAIRELTNNTFQNRQVRFDSIRFDSDKEVSVFSETGIIGLRKNDTIQISGSKLNNGLYIVESVDGKKITVQGKLQFFEGNDSSAFLTKIEYPADILSGVRKLLKYDAKMADKTGLKSKTVSRMSETYFDQNASENVNGYPAALMSFINKYKLLRW